MKAKKKPLEQINASDLGVDTNQESSKLKLKNHLKEKLELKSQMLKNWFKN